MTSRADPTILERILDGREPLLDLMSEYRAAIEQEVRDEIKAVIEAELAVASDAPDGFDSGALAAYHHVLAAISSSSATETQDGLPDANRVGGYSAYGEPYAEDAYDSATETQDGERLRAALEAAASEGRNVVPDATDDDAHIIEEWAATALGTPTPDDRDRERKDSMTKRPVLRLTGAQLASIDPPVSEEWFIDADEYEDFVVAATPGEVERGKNWYGSTMERAGAAARHATPTPDDRDHETAWLIERGQSMGQVPTVWYSGEDYGEQWTTDANRALRYPSKEAAEAEIDLRSGHPIPSHGGPEGSRFGVAVEHGWIVTPTPDDRDREVERIAAAKLLCDYFGGHDGPCEAHLAFAAEHYGG